MTHVLLLATLALRPLLLVNRGNDAIFAVRVGHADASSWGDDLLGFDGVIDVSHGQSVKVSFDPSTCVYDIQATYRNGAVVVVRNVDLCSADRLDIPGAP